MTCIVCSHPKSSHGDDKAPQWERPCWFLVNGVRCPCTGYVVDRGEETPMSEPLPKDWPFPATHDCSSCQEYSHERCDTCWEQATAAARAEVARKGREALLSEPEGEGWDAEVRITKRDLHTMLNRQIQAVLAIVDAAPEARE